MKLEPQTNIIYKALKFVELYPSQPNLVFYSIISNIFCNQKQFMVHIFCGQSSLVQKLLHQLLNASCIFTSMFGNQENNSHMKRFRATIHYVNFNIINFASELVPNEPSCFLWYTFIKYDFRREHGKFSKGSPSPLWSEIVQLGLGLS